MAKTSKSSHAHVGGHLWKLNIAGDGVITPIINSLFKQLAVMIDHHSKVWVVRFDLSTVVYSNDNKQVSDFVDGLKKWLVTNYRVKRVAYTWVREYETAKRQHYHFVLILDGNKVNTSFKLLDFATDLWKAITGQLINDGELFEDGRLQHIKSVCLNRGDETKRLDVGYWLSYLAKVKGKSYRPDQTKDYNSSRLK